jgi:hypothetical protein
VTPREVVIAFFDCMTRRDVQGAMRFIHPEFVEDYPQSGERVRGRANLQQIINHYPGGVGTADEPPSIVEDKSSRWLMTPGYTVVNVEESGMTATLVLKVRYPDGQDWWMLAWLEIRNDMVLRQTTYFAQPFEAPEWRAQWVERIDGT